MRRRRFWRGIAVLCAVAVGGANCAHLSVARAEENQFVGVNSSEILTYSGDSEMDDRFSDFVVLQDGSYIVCGSTDAEVKGGYGDTFCIKYDKDGALIWETTVKDSLLPSIVQTEEGVLLVGNSISQEGVFAEAQPAGEGDAAAVLIDGEGNPVWGVQIGGSAYDSFGSSYYTKTNTPVIMDNGNFLVAGTTNSSDGKFAEGALGEGDGFLAELSSEDGSLVKLTPMGGSEYDSLTSLSRTDDGEYIVGGTTNSVDGLFEGSSDWTEGNTFVAKLDAELNPVWVSMVNTHGLSWGAGAVVLPDGSIVLATGQADADYNTEEQSSVTLVKFDQVGKQLWSKEYEAGPFNYVVSITATDDGTVLLVTETYDEEGHMCSLLGEVDEGGEMLWSTVYAAGDSILTKARKLAEGQYVASGYAVMKAGDYASSMITYQPVSDEDQLVVEEQVKSQEVAEDVSYADGTYEGVGRGMYNGLHVTVTIKDGKIDAIEMGENREDPPYVDNASEGVIPAILKAQSTDVDGVSGATYSSNGIKAAVDYALEQAAK